MLPIFQTGATVVTGTLGESATYATLLSGGTRTLNAIVERDVMTPLPAFEGALVERQHTITVRAADLVGHTPALGDTVTVGAETWKVLSIEQHDGYLIRLKVRLT